MNFLKENDLSCLPAIIRMPKKSLDVEILENVRSWKLKKKPHLKIKKYSRKCHLSKMIEQMRSQQFDTVVKVRFTDFGKVYK